MIKLKKKKKERLHKIGKRRRQRIDGGKGLIMDVDMGYIKMKRYTYNKENTKHTSQCYPKAEACGRIDYRLDSKQDERTKVEKKAN